MGPEEKKLRLLLRPRIEFSSAAVFLPGNLILQSCSTSFYPHHCSGFIVYTVSSEYQNFLQHAQIAGCNCECFKIVHIILEQQLS